MESNPVTKKPGLLVRFCRRVCTWRNARRMLVTVAVMVTLTAVFHTEENWRGRRVWEQCKRELEAKGIAPDWSAYLPRPVPDDQNVFKAPNMQAWFVRHANDPTRLLKRMEVTNNYPVPIVELTPQQARDYVTWSDQFQPEFDQMRKALKRPQARMEGSYDDPFNSPIPNFVMMRTVAQTLARRAQCYLVLGESGKALHELTLLHNLCCMLDYRVTGHPVMLVTAMINVAVSGLHSAVIADGLQMHGWREPELTALQHQLKDVDLPVSIAEAFHCEPAAAAHTIEMYSRAQLARMLDDRRQLRWYIQFGPRGWLWQNIATGWSLGNRIGESYNLSTGLVDPSRAEAVGREAEQLSDGPYTFLARITVPNFTKAWRTMAHNQTMVNLALISCALERYHLTNGRYPDSLDALVPQFVEKIPHDIIGGQPLHYHLTDNGKFVLYSIGWNETDDGGQMALNQFGREDMSKGDWVLSGISK